jgi:hypothetical protein
VRNGQLDPSARNIRRAAKKAKVTFDSFGFEHAQSHQRQELEAFRQNELMCLDGQQVRQVGLGLGAPYLAGLGGGSAMFAVHEQNLDATLREGPPDVRQ